MSARGIIEALECEAHVVVPLLLATLFVTLPASAQCFTRCVGFPALDLLAGYLTAGPPRRVAAFGATFGNESRSAVQVSLDLVEGVEVAAWRIAVAVARRTASPLRSSPLMLKRCMARRQAARSVAARTSPIRSSPR